MKYIILLLVLVCTFLGRVSHQVPFNSTGSLNHNVSKNITKRFIPAIYFVAALIGAHTTVAIVAYPDIKVRPSRQGKK